MVRGEKRSLGRRLLIALVALFVALVVALVVGYVFAREATTPTLDGTLTLDGLDQPVRVEREDSGVAHVRAETDHDAMFALGVVHSQDRLWQMEFQRRVGAGRLSEVLGEATVEQDRFLRTVGFYRAAESAYANLDGETRASVDAYVEGINAYLETDPDLPAEFRILGYRPGPWRPADVLVWAKMMSFDLSANYESELTRYALRAGGVSPERITELMPPYPEDAPTMLSSEDLRMPADAGASEQANALLDARRALPESLEASNNWVVSGAKTESGKPLLANDPHLGFQVPSLWYLAHVESPGYDAIGATLPGLPAVVIGRNDSIAWGVTNVGADVQDLYRMEESDDGLSYRYRGEARPYRTRTERIEVADGETVEIEVRDTVNGPVISDVVDDPGQDPLALRWTTLDDEDGTMQAFLNVQKAGDWEEFNEALRTYKAPSQNFVYADRDGDIGYVAPGSFPIRADGHSGLAPIPGDGEYNWRGYIPFDEWPRTLNPEKEFIVTANNKATPEDYPYDISLEWAEPYRAERIEEMISTSDDLTPQDMVRVQQDQKSLLFEDFEPVLRDLDGLSNDAAEWRERLLAWDGEAIPDSQDATVFEAWYAELARLPADEVGEDFWNEPRYLLAALEGGDPNCEPRTSEGCMDFAAEALERSVSRFDGDVPEWGEEHPATFEHPVLTDTPLGRFSDREIPFGGDQSTVNVGSHDFRDFTMTGGPSYRHVVDLASPERSLYIHPMGQSGNLMSTRFDDLLPMWQSGEYLTMKTSGYRTEKSLTLEPE